VAGTAKRKGGSYRLVYIFKIAIHDDLIDCYLKNTNYVTDAPFLKSVQVSLTLSNSRGFNLHRKYRQPPMEARVGRTINHLFHVSNHAVMLGLTRAPPISNGQ
jgi:hypothetical protein